LHVPRLQTVNFCCVVYHQGSAGMLTNWGRIWCAN